MQIKWLIFHGIGDTIMVLRSINKKNCPKEIIVTSELSAKLINLLFPRIKVTILKSRWYLIFYIFHPILFCNNPPNFIKKIWPLFPYWKKFDEFSLNLHKTDRVRNLLGQKIQKPVKKIRQQFIPKNSLVGILPGSSALLGNLKYKSLPCSFWDSIIDQLSKNNNEIYLIGTRSDLDEYSELKNKLDFNYISNLEQAVDLIKKFDIIFSVDNGLSHLADFYNKKIYVIYTLTNYLYTGVRGSNTTIIVDPKSYYPDFLARFNTSKYINSAEFNEMYKLHKKVNSISSENISRTIFNNEHFYYELI